MAMSITSEIERPQEPEPERDPVEVILREQLSILQTSAERLAESNDTEAVHELRVAARRLRSALKLFGSAFPKRLRNRSRKALKQLSRVPDSVRTWDTHRAILLRLCETTGAPAEKAALEHVLELVDERRAVQRDALLSELEEIDVSRLTGTLDRLAKQARGGKRAKRRLRDASKVVWLLAEKLEELPERGPESQPEDVQRARGPLRRLRHALELLEPSVTGVGDLATPVKQLEEALGDHADRVRTLQLLEERRAQLSGGGRTVLAEGLGRAIDRLEEERRGIFERLSKQSEKFDRRGLVGKLRTLLSQGEADEQENGKKEN